VFSVPSKGEGEWIYLYLSTPMSSSDQCAVGPDGNLLPASGIVWYNDPADVTPLPPAPSSPKGTQIDDFFPRRTSTRVPRPSARAADPNNTEAVKRKASRDLNDRCSKARARTSSESTESTPELDDDGDEIPDLKDASDSEDDDDAVEGGEDGEDDEADVEAAYQATKELGDADREVNVATFFLMFGSNIFLHRRQWVLVLNPTPPRTSGPSMRRVKLWMLTQERLLRVTGVVSASTCLHNCLVIALLYYPLRASGVSLKKSFFLGNVTARRTHIKR
jgi:hypothetical protein